jgi:hypothetical protein
MGFDVSYHPVSEAELKEWYFDALTDETMVDILIERFEIASFCRQRYQDIVQAGRDTAPNQSFDKTHAFYAAVVQGFFRTYFYIRGGAFTFVLEEKPEYRGYTMPWAEILGREITQPVKNQIVENYCGGVYIPAGQVTRLLADITSSEQVRADLLKVFGEGTLDVFVLALEYAQENGLGLLEATEVVEPDPLDLENSLTYSNLYNCDTTGPLLYADIAARQLAEVIAAQEADNTKKKDSQQGGGFFKNLFGKKS